MRTVLRVAVALFSIGAGVLHWDLWANHGYRSTPVREMFVASAVLGVLVGFLALVDRRGAVVPAVVANAAFLGGFALSRTSEVPTFHGGWSESGLAPDGATLGGLSTTLVLVVAEGLAVLSGVTALLAGRRRPRSQALPASVARA